MLNILYKIQSTFVVILTTRLKIQTNPKDGGNRYGLEVVFLSVHEPIVVTKRTA